VESRVLVDEEDRAVDTAAGGLRDRAQGVEDDCEWLTGRDQLEESPLTGEEGLSKLQVRNPTLDIASLLHHV